MLSSYVCRQCRTSLLQHAATPRNLQWQQRATFISLRSGAASAETPEPKPQDAPVGQTPAGTTTPRPGQRPSRYAKHLQPPPADESVEAEDTIEPTETRPIKARPVRITRQITREYRPAETRLENALNQGKLDEAWSHFCQAYPQDEAVDVQQLHRYGLLRRLHDDVVVNFGKDREQIVTPTRVIFRYHQLGLFKTGGMRFELFPDAIRTLTNLVLVSTAGLSKQINRSREAIFAELLSLWQLMFQCRGPKKASLDSLDTQWQSLPDVATLNPAFLETRDIAKRLAVYLPRVLEGHATLAFSATTIFGFLNENSKLKPVSDELRSEAEPFVSFLAHILAGADLGPIRETKNQSPSLRGLPKEFHRGIVENFKNAPLHAKVVVSKIATTKAPGSEAKKPMNPEEYMLKRIARAVQEQSHNKRLDSLWKEAELTFAAGEGKTAIPLRVYNEFLTGYLQLLAADRSVQVWNHMMEQGVKPDVRTWTAMLTGCVKSKDLQGMNAMWDRMVRSGIQPDNFAWTTRVHGLISLRQINDGLAAMDEMGRQWQHAEKASKLKGATPKAPANKPPKPSVEVINAAISAVTQNRNMDFHRKSDLVRNILHWSRSFEIKPDARTYNILIQLYIAGNDHATTFKLLKQMETEGVEPDMATYTTLIRASFDNENFSGLSTTEQTERVLELFASLEARGLKLNSYVYSITIDRLLKQYNNYSAVRAVVDYMLPRGVSANPHIYTSLVTHYFQQQPPDIEAVDGLWIRITRTPGVSTDKVLFDRIIEGYAACGEIGKMMAVLTTMSKHGKLPGWMALTAVVKALAEAGEWERAQNVVRDVQNGQGVAEGGITGGNHGQRDFLELVARLGIMEPGAGISKFGWEEQAAGGGVADLVGHPDKIASSIMRELEEQDWLRDLPSEGDGKPVGTPKQVVDAEDNGNMGGVPL